MGGGEIKIVFNILKMSNFLLEIWENSEKKTLIFGGLKTKREGGGGGGGSEDRLQETKYERFFCCKYP